MFLRFGLGADAPLWRNLMLGLEAGPTFRRISVGDEITRSTLGGALALDLAWRFQPSPGWSLTPTVQWTAALYKTDYFYWNDVALLLSVQRTGP
jgi:hypothetical protein